MLILGLHKLELNSTPFTVFELLVSGVALALEL